MCHSCGSTDAGDSHDNDSGIISQVCLGFCGACKQHLGFTSTCGTWGGSRIFKAPQSDVELVHSLQRHVELVTAAFKRLHHLKMLVRWHLNYVRHHKALTLAGPGPACHHMHCLSRIIGTCDAVKWALLCYVKTMPACRGVLFLSL